MHQAFSNDDYPLGDNPIRVAVEIVKRAMTSYTWTFVDTFIVILFLILSTHFKSLADNALQITQATREEKLTFTLETVRNEFEKLCEILKMLNEFLSPLLLMAYITNITILSMHASTRFNM